MGPSVQPQLCGVSSEETSLFANAAPKASCGLFFRLPWAFRKQRQVPGRQSFCMTPTLTAGFGFRLLSCPSTRRGECRCSGGAPPKHPGGLGCWGTRAEPPPNLSEAVPASSTSAPHGRGCFVLPPTAAPALHPGWPWSVPPSWPWCVPPRPQRFPGGAEPWPGAPQLMPSMTFRCVSPPNTFPGPSPASIHLLLTLLLANRVSGWGGLTGRAAPAAPGAR